MKHCQLKECRREEETPGARYCANDGSELGDVPYQSALRKTVGVIGGDVSG